jgi:hypothetical protein
MDDTGFDLKCRRVVVRRIIQQMKDFRLNPRLQKACRNDMSKFCAELFVPANGESPHFLEGKVIDCLKREYVKEDNKLTEACKGKSFMDAFPFVSSPLPFPIQVNLATSFALRVSTSAPIPSSCLRAPTPSPTAKSRPTLTRASKEIPAKSKVGNLFAAGRVLS